MGDVGHSSELGIHHEKPASLKLDVAFGSHVIGSEKRDNGNVWHSDLVDQIEKWKPRPTVIAIDGLVSGFNYYLDDAIPVKDPKHFLPAGEVLHIIAADLGVEEEAQMLIPDNSKVVTTLFDRLSQLDPVFRPPEDPNDFMNHQLEQAFSLQQPISAGLLYLTADLMVSVLDRGKKKPMPAQHVRKSGMKGVPNPARREFMRMAGQAIGASTVATLWPNVFNSLETQTEVSQYPSLITQIANIIRPIMFHTEWEGIRNAKVGLATIDYLSTEGHADDDGLIVLGNGHKKAIYPGQLEGETVAVTRKRLATYLEDTLGPAIYQLRAQKVASDEVLAQVLQEYLAAYTVFNLPQKPADSITIAHRSDQAPSSTVSSVPEISDMIKRWMHAG